MRRIQTHCLSATCTAASYLIGEDGYCSKCSQRHKLSLNSDQDRLKSSGYRQRPSRDSRVTRNPSVPGAARPRSMPPSPRPSSAPTHHSDGMLKARSSSFRPAQNAPPPSSLRSASVGRSSSFGRPANNHTPPSRYSSRSSSLGRTAPGTKSSLYSPTTRSPSRSLSSSNPSTGTNATSPNAGPQRRPFGTMRDQDPPSKDRRPLGYPSPRAMKAERSVGFAASGKSQGGACKTPGCNSSVHLLQMNGFCTSCNDTKNGGPRGRLRAVGSLHAATNQGGLAANNIGTNPLNRAQFMPPRSIQALTEKTSNGSAFGGRLEFVVPPRAKAVERSSATPTAELVDYQFLRLKFLLNKAVGQQVHPVEVFGHFDTDGSGGIDTHEFATGLKALGIYLSEAENMALLSRFGAGDGTIKYQSFLDILGLGNIVGEVPTGSNPIKDSTSKKEASEVELDEILKNIHKEIQQLALSGKGGKPNYKKVFETFDKDGGGSIDLAEFMEGLSDLGLDLKAKQMSQISKIFDADGQGTIDYDEFAKFCEARDASEAIQHSKLFVARKKKAASKSKFDEFELTVMVQDVHKEINRIGRSKGRTPDFQAMFRDMDTDGGGQVDISEFLEGLAHLGFEFSLKQAVQIAKVFDADGTGLIASDEFCAFCEAKEVHEALRISKSLKATKKKTKRAPKAIKKPKPVDNTALMATVESIHKEINRLAVSKYGTPDFKKLFSTMDNDGGGQLEVVEFLEGLAKFGFLLKLKQASQIVSLFDSEGDGTVDYAEFVEFCEAKDAAAAMQIREKRNAKRKTK